MTRSEFKQVGVDVFAELLPKTKSADVQEFLAALLTELQEQGLDVEDDGDSDEESDDYED